MLLEPASSGRSQLSGFSQRLHSPSNEVKSEDNYFSLATRSPSQSIESNTTLEAATPATNTLPRIKFVYRFTFFRGQVKEQHEGGNTSLKTLRKGKINKSWDIDYSLQLLDLFDFNARK